MGSTCLHRNIQREHQRREAFCLRDKKKCGGMKQINCLIADFWPFISFIVLFIFVYLFVAHERMVFAVRKNIENEKAQIVGQIVRTNEKARIILALQNKRTFRYYADTVYHRPKLRYYNDEDQIILADIIASDLERQK